jgi:hypothetical protein
MNGKQKIKLAIHIGKNITQEQFENELGGCFNALTRTWELAF